MPAIECFDEDAHAERNGYGDNEDDLDLFGMPESYTYDELVGMAATMAEAKYNEKMTAAPSIEEKEIYIPEEWAHVTCLGLSWAYSEGALDYRDAKPLLDWVKAKYSSAVEEFPELF